MFRILLSKTLNCIKICYFKFTPTTPPIAPATIPAIIIIIEYIFSANPFNIILDSIYINNIYINPIIPPFTIPFFLSEPAAIELPN